MELKFVNDNKAITYTICVNEDITYKQLLDLLIEKNIINKNLRESCKFYNMSNKLVCDTFEDIKIDTKKIYPNMYIKVNSPRS